MVLDIQAGMSLSIAPEVLAKYLYPGDRLMRYPSRFAKDQARRAVAEYGARHEALNPGIIPI
jgi:hypothetical protein